MIKAIIVDDEELGRTMLSNLLAKFCPHVTIIGMAGSLKEAKRLIKKLKPELLFLDIEMPRGSGFELLEALEEPRDLAVIFTTAYDQYAVKAFKYSAVDYLLKPINIEELMHAVKKLESTQSKKDMQPALQHLIESYNNSGVSKSNNNIALPTFEGLVFTNIQNIIRCEADAKYTYCFMQDGRKIHSTRSMKELEEQLEPFGFSRIHHAHLVNLYQIRNYLKGEGGEVTMSNGEVISVSKRKKEDFLNRLKKL